MSLQMLKAKRQTLVAGEFDDEELMKLYSMFDFEVRSRKNVKQPLLDHFAKLGNASLEPLRRQYIVPDGESDAPSEWQTPAALLAALRAFRKVLDHDDAPYLAQQIWLDSRKPPPDPPDRHAADEYIAATEDLIDRVQAAIERKATKVRLYFDPALL